MIRFIHTADWQIGKPFAGIADDHKRVLVQQERVAVLDRIADAARAHEAAFVLVAGDLFDSPTPTQAMVSAACAAIGRIGVPVYAIPGNHDHGGPGGPWKEGFLLREQASLAPNLRMLTTAEPFETETAVIFPCPLLRRAESADVTAWLRNAEVLDRAGDKARIILAHGSTQDFGPEADDEDALSSVANQIDLARIHSAAFDYAALGDWHGTKQVSPKAWYSGTPERDRFPKGEGNLPGNVLAVSVVRGGESVVEMVPTSRLGWKRLERHLSEDGDVDLLAADIESLFGQRTQQDLLRLELSGSLGIAAMTRLEELLGLLEARLLCLKLVDQTAVAPTDGEILAMTQRITDPLVARVARQLVEKTSDGGEDAAIAGIALRQLHAACHPR